MHAFGEKEEAGGRIQGVMESTAFKFAHRKC